MVPYYLQDSSAPLPFAFHQVRKSVQFICNFFTILLITWSHWIFFWFAPFGYLYSFSFQCNGLHPSSIQKESNSRPVDHESTTLTTTTRLSWSHNISRIFNERFVQQSDLIRSHNALKCILNKSSNEIRFYMKVMKCCSKGWMAFYWLGCVHRSLVRPLHQSPGCDVPTAQGALRNVLWRPHLQVAVCRASQVPGELPDKKQNKILYSGIHLMWSLWDQEKLVTLSEW